MFDDTAIASLDTINYIQLTVTHVKTYIVHALILRLRVYSLYASDFPNSIVDSVSFFSHRFTRSFVVRSILRSAFSILLFISKGFSQRASKFNSFKVLESLSHKFNGFVHKIHIKFTGNAYRLLNYLTHYAIQ